MLRWVRGTLKETRRLARATSNNLQRRLVSTQNEREIEAVIAIGSNQGDRVSNIWSGIKNIAARTDTKVLQYSSLYETAPAYFTDQDEFLNTAILVRTRLGPLDLLDALKGVEAAQGRALQGGIRYGPRPLDLDIVFYGDKPYSNERLEIPHPRWKERSFVIAPLADLKSVEMASGANAVDCSKYLEEAKEAWLALNGGRGILGGDEIRRVTPVGKKAVVDFSSKSHVMGILNVTPDSFSDGGLFLSKEKSLEKVKEMVSHGADIVDLGGQSTRPGAKAISAEEECERVMPVIEAIKSDERYSDVLISVDTFHSKVAGEAVKLGADIVNDISAGNFDENMHKVVAGLNTPYIMMHTRGTPQTMQSEENTTYKDLISEIAQELDQSVEAAVQEGGVMPWCIVSDPGIGFAKDHSQNRMILKHCGAIRRSFASGFLRNAPMLVGPSRKGFLGSIVNRKDPKDRDVATSAALVIAAMQGCNIFRVHNVKVARDALKVADAIHSVSLQ